ncbi:hypothetical protein BS47DRAFT_1370365 [Hydnum rufescens UP504]|uniref:Ubiquitin-like protease family profile domain-containing protein n=1 Tax=Hydnum rufescens UP504 TaxID=1448309 RepID=A0A9P6BAC1_9AGAM|nr:hypothetical protein BS47DRAFT_1370365 [Hydnum rufescens UP504]
MLHIRSGLVSTCGREQVQGEDIQRLRPAQWLNDEVINFYGAMITERAARQGREQGDPLDVHYFNTFFYEKLVNPGYEKARLNKWSKKVDIFSKDVILIPINLGNSHWTCACINVRRKRIEYYDSLGTRREVVYQRLREYLQRESLDKKKIDFEFEDWEDYFSEATPQQENAYDCGVFVCQFMEAISRGEDAEEFAFDQRNMPYIRRRMLWEISEKRLIGWKQ